MTNATRRSRAWIYYAVLAVLTLIAIPKTNGLSLIVTALCALYAVYLYRGGKVVIWFW